MSSDSSIDPAKVEVYIATLGVMDDEKRARMTVSDYEAPEPPSQKMIEQGERIVRKVVANTIYIRYHELIESLMRSIERLEAMVPLYNLYIPDGKIGSEHWLILQLRDVLHPVEKFYGVEDVKKRLRNDYPIVVIDDAIYSSVHMCAIVEKELRYRCKIKNKVYCVVAVTSSLNLQVCEYNAEIIADRNLEHLRADKLLGEDYDYDLLYKLFGVEYLVLPIYFDHKIANEFGSYQFYHQIIRHPVDRSPIDKITKADVEEYVRS